MTILVTGATGNVGRLVVDQLLALNATDVRALTNNPEKAALPEEVEVFEGYGEHKKAGAFRRMCRLATSPAALF